MNIKILVNMDEYELHSHSVPIKLFHDIFSNINNNGSLALWNVYIPKKYNIVSNVELIINDNIIKLGKPTMYKRYDEWSTFMFEVSDIFEIYRMLLSYLKKDKFHALLVAFDTPSLCNLRCSYCSKSMNLRQSDDQTDLFLTQKYSDRIFKILKRIYGSNLWLKYLRYMGGETFLSKDTFNQYVKYFSSKNLHYNESNKPTALQVYTNLVVPNCISDTFTEFIESDNLFTEYNLWVTIDSVDYTKSLRLENESHELSFMENLLNLSKMKNNHKLKVCFNIMYLDDDTLIETVKLLQSLGFYNYKISFDEENVNNDFMKAVAIKRRELKNLPILRKSNIEKDYYEKLLPISFDITELGRSVVKFSTTFWVDKNVVRIYYNG